MFTIPLGAVLLFLAALVIISFLACLAAYYLMAGEYNFFSLLAAALVFFAVLVFTAVRYNLDASLVTLGWLGMPFSFLAAVWEDADYFFIFAGLVINYLAVFALINFVLRALHKVF